MNIQNVVGFQCIIEMGVEKVCVMFFIVNEVICIECFVFELMVVFQCGGLDVWFGIMVNLVFGYVCDLFVVQGGIGVLVEIFEIYGAEYFLIR